MLFRVILGPLTTKEMERRGEFRKSRMRRKGGKGDQENKEENSQENGGERFVLILEGWTLLLHAQFATYVKTAAYFHLNLRKTADSSV